MNIPDPVTTVVAVNQVAKQAQDFVAAIAGHPGETIGTIVGNLAQRRSKNAEIVTEKAHFTLLNIGFPAAPIALNVLQSLLEGASLQEDPHLQDIWANLIANAADPREQNRVLPSFPLILKELTSRDAKFLDRFYDRYHGKESVGQDILGFWNSFELLAELYPSEGIGLRPLDEMTSEEQAAPGHLYVTLDVLERNRLIEKTYMSSNYTESPPQDVLAPVLHSYQITSLGQLFIMACRAPKAN
jgi:hypothetical protein